MGQLKNTRLRHEEYYDMTDTLDKLYSQSVNNDNFYKLTEIMSSEDNIRLAYRNIKRNTGSKTAGVDGLNITDIEKLDINSVVLEIQKMFAHYKPKAVRRVFIPKGNGKTRPLGIPTIWDRLLQQCILQILNPIMEAKFHNHSYGFRDNRSTHDAIARMNFLINQGGFTQCVDIDIKGFFDNVNHGKLLKQLWTLGVRDKKLIKIISVMLKSEIEGEGTPTQGTPQGGILSPLLSNIVLNELDWWISNQWETFQPRKNYHKQSKYKMLRKSKLKEIFIVRYADDFKILCRTRSDANRTFIAVKKFLKERLQLDISTEKSKVVNLKREGSEFLGLQIRANKKGGTKKGIISYSRMTNKAREKAKVTIKECIKDIQKKPCRETVNKFNTTVIGIQNYYRIATNISRDLREIKRGLEISLYNRLEDNRKPAKITDMSKTLRKRYKNYNCKLFKTDGMVYVPIYAQKHKSAMAFSQDICNYTEEGRRKIHKKLAVDRNILRYVKNSYVRGMSIEYNDNRITKFIAQKGKCAITKVELGLNNWQCHHKIPKKFNGNDRYQNLIILHSDIHKIIHMTNVEKIMEIIKTHNLNEEQINKINELRKLARMKKITCELNNIT